MRNFKLSAALALSLAGSAALLASAGASAATANRAPVISGAPLTAINEPTWYVFIPTASDADGNRLRYSIANKPDWATFDTGTGRLRGWISKWYAGKTFSNIVISVSDGKKTVALPAFSIKYSVATAANRAPTIAGAPALSATVGQAYAFQPTAKDPEGKALAFSVKNKPAWASFSTATGKLSGTPSAAGSFGPVTITVSDGKAQASLAAFSIAVKAPVASTNRAPTISGSPATSLQVGQTFAFQPAASDADGDTLSFSVQNKPAWASFNSKTGQLAGTPGAADVGTFANIAIKVSDGKTQSALKSFALTVNQVSLGAATVSWTPPTQNVDGSSLTNLAGYRILYGTRAGQYTQSLEVKNPGLTSLMVENLAPATYYFAVKVFTSSGAESDLSNAVAKVVN